MTTLESLTASESDLSAHVATHLAASSTPRYWSLFARLREELGVEPERSVVLASSPGRTELGGNHTDHNHGKVLAASVQLDTIAAVAPRDDTLVRFASEGFSLVELDLTDHQVRESERETTASLIRGVAAAFSREGHRVGGFDAAVSSRVAAGSGLSSSASVEVLVGTILDHVFNSGHVGSTFVARAGQFAENQFFGKPSGLMDQVACATGGIVSIDFRDNDRPVIVRHDADFGSAGLTLLVVDSGSGHADLTGEYAAIPEEMKAVAGVLGAEVLSEVSEKDVLGSLARVRAAVGDRGVARALHFFAENDRVDAMVEALDSGDFAQYLFLMTESGRSSAAYLQNCAPAGSPREQAVVIALALTDRFFTSAGLRPGRDAACRVHGGGFAGTIQVLLPRESLGAYVNFIEPLLGRGCTTELHVRKSGALAW